MPKIWILLFAGFYGSLGIAQPLFWRCESASHMRQGNRQYPASGHFSFYENRNERGRRVLSQIQGGLNINVLPPREDERRRHEFDYKATFAISELNENARFKSVRYPLHSQFREFNTNIVQGRDSGGMWGNWLMEKELEPKIELAATYVFQAGDHLGGSLDFTCRKQGQGSEFITNE